MSENVRDLSGSFLACGKDRGCSPGFPRTENANEIKLRKFENKH